MRQRGARVLRALVFILILAVVVGGAVLGYRQLAMRRSRVTYITRPVAYADVTSSVTETGTVNPVNEIQVGTQVSGTIATLNVDYNSKVKPGQVLATLDPTNFQAAVSQDAANLQATQATAAATQNGIATAQAAVQTAQGTLAQAQASVKSAQANAVGAVATLSLANTTVQRDAQLLSEGYIAQNQMDTDKTAVQTATANVRATQAAVQVAEGQLQAATSQVQAARAGVTTAGSQAAASGHQVQASAAQLRQAQYQLGQTVIKSPVDGIVMARNVTVGQTVAASLSTPTLFTIATNLADMQVDTSVDEADIGSVKPGDSAQITVTAFPNVTFAGTVQQVRINPTIVQNVVTYDAVVAVHDTSGRLLPGMTAQVTINTGTVTHVLTVPIAAVLYRPTFSRAGGGAGGGGAFLVQGGTSQGGPSAPVAGAPGSTVTVWELRGGRPVPTRIVIGASDASNIQVKTGPLEEGTPLIIAQRIGGPGNRRAGGGRSAGGAGGGPGAGGPAR
jgi:HlyD family secretion protein